jgi:two-component sensor histidine kinase
MADRKKKASKLIQEKKGVDFKENDSLGFQTVNDLVRQLDGNIRLVRGDGTIFLVTF